jgi:hypothetical protein
MKINNVSNHDSIDSYSGDGFLCLELGIELKCQFLVEQHRDGDIILICSLKDYFNINTILKAEKFEGNTTDGKQVSCKYFYHKSSSLSSEENITTLVFFVSELSVILKQDVDAHVFRFGITNFEFFGIEPDIIKMPDGKIWHVLSLPLHLSHNNKEITVTIKNIGINDDLMKLVKDKKVALVTCEAVVTNYNNYCIKDITEIITNLCYILSIARGTKINWIYYNILNDSGECSSRFHRSNITKSYNILKIIDSGVEGRYETKEFIECAYFELYQSKNKLNLDNMAIDAYLDAKAESDFLEMRGAKLAVSMEIIKNKYISYENSHISEFIIEKKKYSCYQKVIKKNITDYFESIGLKNELIESICNNISNLNRTSFRAIIIDICNAIGLNFENEEINWFVKSRNSLIHTGEFYNKKHKNIEFYKSSIHEFLYLITFLDKIFLKTLNYKGVYIDWSEPNKPERKILS